MHLDEPAHEQIDIVNGAWGDVCEQKDRSGSGIGKTDTGAPFL